MITSHAKTACYMILGRASIAQAVNEDPGRDDDEIEVQTES